MATKPDSAMKAVQTDLVTLGYLPKGGDDGVFGALSTRAVKRFQRHARRIWRMSAVTGKPADVAAGDVFKGVASGTPDAATLAEIRKWLDNGWKLPLGRFAIVKTGDARLREDVADAWTALVNKIKSLGGTIAGPYGDTKRSPGKSGKDGASSYSFHIVGRAIDLQQKLAGPPGQRYHVAKDLSSDARNFWRIYCKTDNQDGTQGKKYEKDAVDCWSFFAGKTYKLPAGHYLDLTAEIQKDGLFERIAAHAGWETHYNRAEWWHFQWVADKQETFQDECELVGIGESDLKAAGYSRDDMDHKPG